MDRSSSGVEEHSVNRLLPGDNPQAYLPGDRRTALARGEDLPRRTTGSAVFVDISGFTPLTEALATELGARRGAEELTATLDRVFSALLERLHVWRGSVIYFSGDAVTAWLDGDDGLGAVACALEMQRVMDGVGLVRTPQGREVRLGVKVAVATGPVHRFVVGDPDVQLVDVLAGSLTESLASAEQVSESGDVVVDAGAMASLGDRVAIAELRAGEHGPVGVVAGLTVAASDPGPASAPPVLSEDLVRPWVLPPVWERMAAGRGEFLAELRPAVPVFLRFGGLDFEADDSAPERLDRFVRRTQRILATHGGYVLQLTIGDKGAYLYAVFGAPVAHEDDAARACAAALELLADEEPLTVTDLQVGIASGRLRSGTYGHRQRRTFCCLGDAVNLAARLMSKAPTGSVWVHEDVARATGTRFAWRALQPLTLKGKTRPAAARELLGRAQRVPAARRSSEDGPAAVPLVGRAEETALLHARWQEAQEGRGHTVVVQGEAGTGKSRLVAEAVRAWERAGVTVASGEASAVAGAAYLGWRDVWAELLGVDPSDATPASVTAAVAALDAGLTARTPLLQAVLGVPLPDSDLTGSFDAELRKTSLEDLLSRLLRARAATSPLVVHLEDAQLLDPLSRDLLAVLARVAAGLPVLLLVTARPDGTAYAGMPVTATRATDLVLEGLPEDAARELVTARHRTVSGRNPGAEVVDLVVTRAEGNAFYLEQLVDYLAARATEGADEDPEADDLPASLHSLVLSRIDTQPEGPRQSLKVASVLGRSFASRLVAGTYPDLGDDDEVDGHLLAVSSTRLVAPEDRAARTFAFGHSVTRDVAYESIPYAVRTVLHGRAGDALEAEPDGPVRSLDLLVHHYGHSDDLAQQRRYFVLGAENARSTYDIDRAVDLLERALPLVEPVDRAPVLLSLAEALESRGDWAGAEDAVSRALDAAEDVGDDRSAARARVARAELDRKQGRYADAAAGLDKAERGFADLDDRAGRARVLHLRGTLASQQGDPAAARAAYQESLQLRQTEGDAEGVAAMLTNLALCAEDEGDLDGAERIGRDALERLRTLRDRKTESVALINMGMLALARDDLSLARERFGEARELAELIGDPWMVAIVGHNQGNVDRQVGELGTAAGHLRASLEAYAERDDRWYLAQVLEDIALWLLTDGGTGTEAHDHGAVALVAAAGAVRAEIGAPRFASAENELEDALAPVRRRRSVTAQADALEAGESWTLTEALDAARRLLTV
ncbi:AAA family ATPase [Nocardioides sp. HDW12B]|uniref:AAA family ATPase n=1 Tax=Nocardioides sp. HDW12B TaxID=2714939 RepID=UPI00140ADF3F|nr:AAA family ATPase [Nocardioides sp. HDW12B]QIK66202.1 AAA family ATPase [Nocardioides sp. HDW12B]